MKIRKAHQLKSGLTPAAARQRTQERSDYSFADVKLACHRHLVKTDEVYVREQKYFARHRPAPTAADPS